MKKANCDLCIGTIQEGNGFLLCSSASGLVLLCESCCNEVLGEEAWNDSRDFRVTAERQAVEKGSFTELVLDLIPQLQKHNAAGIVSLCKARGLTAQQARAKGREHAQLWWENPEKALSVSRLFRETGRE